MPNPTHAARRSMTARRGASLLLLALGCVVSIACLGRRATPAVIPAYLVGEWASEDAAFENGAIAKGSALYLEADGTGALIGAPPPIGMRITARFDSAAALLNAKMLGDGGEAMGEQRFRYDGTARTLQMLDADEGPVTFRRRQDSVPDYIRRMMVEAAKGG